MGKSTSEYSETFRTLSIFLLDDVLPPSTGLFRRRAHAFSEK